MKEKNIFEKSTIIWNIFKIHWIIVLMEGAMRDAFQDEQKGCLKSYWYGFPLPLRERSSITSAGNHFADVADAGRGGGGPRSKCWCNIWTGVN